ncbi:MAG TPA: hypothetical protein VJC16_01430 [Candidatus Nanoarchaeia archaeon]|nr:hypothetical protein [Candidatus Nanoarchaeia archaeon]
MRQLPKERTHAALGMIVGGAVGILIGLIFGAVGAWIFFCALVGWGIGFLFPR